MSQLVIFGTGYATATRCYNTCFAIKSDEGVFLVDAGGGNEILRRLEAAGINLEDIRGMFVTHGHTDHIIGAVWIIRVIEAAMKSGKYSGEFPIYGHDEVCRTLKFMCDNMLANGAYGWAGGKIRLNEVKDGDTISAAGKIYTVFDIFSSKKKQFGFTAEIEGNKLVCLGDEPFNPKCERYVSGVDILMSEAFCLERDEERFHPHQKSHSTALEAAGLAQRLGAKELILYHTEDTDLAHRRENYTAEAARAFSGIIHVPDDMEVIDVQKKGGSR